MIDILSRAGCAFLWGISVEENEEFITYVCI